jgi:hypothetical protein
MADKRFYIKISGAAWDITGPTAQDAINSIKTHAYAYCGFTALEIGVDCDENGYELPKAPATVKK